MSDIYIKNLERQIEELQKLLAEQQEKHRKFLDRIQIVECNVSNIMPRQYRGPAVDRAKHSIAKAIQEDYINMVQVNGIDRYYVSVLLPDIKGL